MNTSITKEVDGEEVDLNVYEELADQGILFVCGDLTDDTATDIAANIMYRSHNNKSDRISLYINSTGGDIRNAFMVYDVMRFSECEIQTTCIGTATDEAAILLFAGTKGERLATKNSVISIGQLRHDYYYRTTIVDAKNILEQSELDNTRIMEIIAQCSGKRLTKVLKDFDRRKFMNAEEAKEYGLIDKIIMEKKYGK